MLSLAQRAALKDQQKRGGVYLNGTHVSRVRGGADALRQQTDPLEPAGRRFANFVLAIFRFGANAGAAAAALVPPGERREVRGRAKPAALKDQHYSPPSLLEHVSAGLNRGIPLEL